MNDVAPPDYVKMNNQFIIPVVEDGACCVAGYSGAEPGGNSRIQ